MKAELYQDQYEAAESMLNDIYQGGIIGETAYNVINQALQSMGKLLKERSSNSCGNKKKRQRVL